MNAGYYYLIIIYVVWGTTYLAMRVGVGPAGGFPVFSFGAVRCLAAAALLLGIAAGRGQSLKLTAGQLARVALTGLLGWTAAHGLVLYAEREVDSGLAAVAVSAAPLWVLLIGSWLDRRLPKPGQAGFVLAGFLGVAALLYPTLRQSTMTWTSLAGLLLSPACWALASLHMQRHPAGVPVLAASGYQHLFGGLGFLAVSFLLAEPTPRPTFPAMGALVFLIIFGSVIAYTAYVKALSLLPAQVVTTNTYVNPVIAVVLGWVILHEPITGWMLLAMGLITGSVVGILRLGWSKPVVARAAFQRSPEGASWEGSPERDGSKARKE